MKKLTKDEMVSEYDSAICAKRMGIWTILLHVRLVREITVNKRKMILLKKTILKSLIYKHQLCHK